MMGAAARRRRGDDGSALEPKQFLRSAFLVLFESGSGTLIGLLIDPPSGSSTPGDTFAILLAVTAVIEALRVGVRMRRRDDEAG